MAVLATAAYWVTNPLLVGKVVYVPVLAYLGLQAVRTERTALPVVGGVAVGYFLLLDFLPQTSPHPYISGRQLDAMLLMFAYLLGPILFGWYGFFLLPVLFIAMLEAIRIVFPDLLHGERLMTTAEMGESGGCKSAGGGTGADRRLGRGRRRSVAGRRVTGKSRRSNSSRSFARPRSES